MEESLKQIKKMVEKFGKLNLGKDNASMMTRNPKML
jgi:hypothetical protein